MQANQTWKSEPTYPKHSGRLGFPGKFFLKIRANFAWKSWPILPGNIGHYVLSIWTAKPILHMFDLSHQTGGTKWNAKSGPVIAYKANTVL